MLALFLPELTIFYFLFYFLMYLTSWLAYPYLCPVRLPGSALWAWQEWCRCTCEPYHSVDRRRRSALPLFFGLISAFLAPSTLFRFKTIPMLSAFLAPSTLFHFKTLPMSVIRGPVWAYVIRRKTQKSTPIQNPDITDNWEGFKAK